LLSSICAFVWKFGFDLGVKTWFWWLAFYWCWWPPLVRWCLYWCFYGCSIYNWCLLLCCFYLARLCLSCAWTWLLINFAVRKNKKNTNAYMITLLKGSFYTLSTSPRSTNKNVKIVRSDVVIGIWTPTSALVCGSFNDYFSFCIKNIIFFNQKTISIRNDYFL
jgi:hypothetical protein